LPPDAFFDRVGVSYQAEVARALGPLAGEHTHFLAVKARWLRHLAAGRLRRRDGLRVLDVGCGMGLLDRHLGALGEALYGVEVALTPLVAARRAGVRPVLCVSGLPFADATFDLVFTASVLHHVAPGAWSAFLREMGRVARPGGLVVVFEHNPWNPATRWVVSRCAFDRDAVLVGPGRLRRLLRASGLRPVLRRHLLTTPWPGRFYAFLDRALAALPLGAQYLVAAVPEEGGVAAPAREDRGP
jgi:SAM-dependent methyltransferase